MTNLERIINFFQDEENLKKIAERFGETHVRISEPENMIYITSKNVKRVLDIDQAVALMDDLIQ